MRRCRQKEVQERMEETEKAVQTVWDEAIVHGNRLDMLMRGCNNRQHLQKKISREQGMNYEHSGSWSSTSDEQLGDRQW